MLKRIPGGSWKVIYRVDQRFVKNNRDPENTVYGLLYLFVSISTDGGRLRRFGTSTSQHRQLLKDDTQYLLALALADRAIQGITSAEDLWELQIPDGEDELPLRWTDDAEHLLILRNATMQAGVSEEPLSKATLVKSSSPC